MIHIDDKIHELINHCAPSDITRLLLSDNRMFNFNIERVFRPNETTWWNDSPPDLSHSINLLHMCDDKIAYYTSAQIKAFLHQAKLRSNTLHSIKELIIGLNAAVKPTVAKPAKALKKIFEDRTFTPQDYSLFGEDYNNNYIKKTCRLDSIIVVSGEDIRKYYHIDNYYSGSGPLGDSCMRYPECQKYLDIYVKNPNQIKLIVYLVDGAVAGRCLLWLDKYYDVVYYNYEYIRIAIEKYCAEHEYISTYTLDSNTTIALEEVNFAYYPYVDTFMYLNLTRKTVSTNQNSGRWSMRSLNGMKYD